MATKKQTTQTAQPVDVNATLESRGSRYGSFKNHAEITQTLKLVSEEFVERVHGKRMHEHLSLSQKEALEMCYHKIGRILNGDPNYADSWHDIAGYASLEDKILNGQGL